MALWLLEFAACQLLLNPFLPCTCVHVVDSFLLQDYIMQVVEADVEKQQQEAATEVPAAPAAPPAAKKSDEKVAASKAAAQRRLASKVVVPSPNTFDPRQAFPCKEQTV